MADNILGTTGSKGLGSNRKSRMATYSSTVTGLNTGGGVQKIGLGTGRISAGAGGSIRAPQLHAGRVLPFMEETPDAFGPLVSEKAAINGMTRLAGAVEKYTDDINQLRSTEAELRLEAKFRTMFNGDENGEGGFLANKGLSAPEAFESFSAALDEEMKAELDNLNPAAKQKAIMSMFAMRSSYLKQASQYSVQQKELAKQDMKTAERQAIQESITVSPHMAIGEYGTDENGKQSYVPSQMKQRLFSTFEPGELDKAEAAWQQMLLNSAQSIYQRDSGRIQKDGTYSIGEGLDDAKVFMNTVGKSELDTAQLNKLEANIISWEDNEVKQYLSNEKLKEASDKKLRTQVSNTNYVNLVADLYNPQKPNASLEDARKLFLAGQLNKEAFSAYQNELSQSAKVGDAGVEDYDMYMKLNKEITELSGSHGVRSDGMFIGLDIANSGLTRGMKDKLVTLLNSTKDKKMAHNRSKAIEKVGFLIPKTYRPFETGEAGLANMFGRVETTVEAQLESEAMDYYDELVFGEQAITHSEAMDKITKRYETGNEHFNKLPYIPGYGKPRRLDDLEMIKGIVRNASASGNMTEEEVRSITGMISQYNTYMLKYASEFDTAKVERGL